jgi:ABC-type antimicrobial peptide transport system permease subunit
MALGAERAWILAMILRSALTQSLLGLAIGIPVAFYCVQFVKSQLYEMTNVSVSSMAIAIVALLVAAFVAALIPGRRAASIDPMRALRAE